MHEDRLSGMLAVALLACATAGCMQEPDPITILVMDPLATRFACACSPTEEWHDYKQLATALSERYGSHVFVDYNSDLAAPSNLPDVVFGKISDVRAQAKGANQRYRLVGQLTDRNGRTTQRGLIITRAGTSTNELAIAPQRIGLGPERMVEKHAAALATLIGLGIEAPPEPMEISTCPLSIVAVYEGDVDMAAISGYAEYATTCGTFVPTGTVHIVTRTQPVPFIGAFISKALNQREQAAVAAALLETSHLPQVKSALKSRDGLIAPTLGE